MSEYELTYFDARGGAEIIRYVFALAGQEYKDIRLTREEWEAKKPSSLFGCLPELKIGDKPLCQRGVIASMLARKFGLMGKDERDAVYIDMLMGCMGDMGMAMYAAYIEKDETRKAELKKSCGEKMALWLPKLQGFLAANNDGQGFFVGDSVTLGDICVYDTLSWLKGAPEGAEFLAKFPKLDAFTERFESLPKVADWMEKRPKTEH